MGAIANIGMQAAGNAVDAGMGLILGGINDRRQLRQQQKLQEMQMQGSKEMMDYQMQKQYDMWLRTNYNAQKQQLKEAGLNPGLMYGMSGGGGTTTGNASAGVSGATAPSGGREVQDMMGMGLQRTSTVALIDAQRKNIEADTKLKESQVPANLNEPNVQNQGIEESKARIDMMAQQTDNERVKHTLLEIERSIGRNRAWISDRTMDMEISKYAAELDNAIADAQKAMNEAKISDATVKDQIKQIRGMAAAAVLQAGLIKAQTANTKQATILSQGQYNAIGQEIMQNWDKLSQENQKIQLQRVLRDHNIQMDNDKTDELIKAIGDALRITK